jgi:hypothetical protein
LRKVLVVDRHDDPDRREHSEAQDLVIELGLVLVLERVVEQVLPVVEQHFHVNHAESQRDYGQQQQASEDFLAGREAEPAELDRGGVIGEPVGLEQCPEVAPET